MVKTQWRIEMSKFFSETGSGFEGLGGIAVPKLPLNAPPVDPGEGLLPPLIFRPN